MSPNSAGVRDSFSSRSSLTRRERNICWSYSGAKMPLLPPPSWTKLQTVFPNLLPPVNPSQASARQACVSGAPSLRVRRVRPILPAKGQVERRLGLRAESDEDARSHAGEKRGVGRGRGSVGRNMPTVKPRGRTGVAVNTLRACLSAIHPELAQAVHVPRILPMEALP